MWTSKPVKGYGLVLGLLRQSHTMFLLLADGLNVCKVFISTEGLLFRHRCPHGMPGQRSQLSRIQPLLV